MSPVTKTSSVRHEAPKHDDIPMIQSVSKVVAGFPVGWPNARVSSGVNGRRRNLNGQNQNTATNPLEPFANRFNPSNTFAGVNDTVGVDSDHMNRGSAIDGLLKSGRKETGEVSVGISRMPHVVERLVIPGRGDRMRQLLLGGSQISDGFLH